VLNRFFAGFGLKNCGPLRQAAGLPITSPEAFSKYQLLKKQAYMEIPVRLFAGKATARFPGN
jgi:hypothetical protein